MATITLRLVVWKYVNWMEYKYVGARNWESASLMFAFCPSSLRRAHEYSINVKKEEIKRFLTFEMNDRAVRVSSF